jgi:hypothetical protein
MYTLLTKIDDLIASLVIPPVVEEAKRVVKQAEEDEKYQKSYFPLSKKLRRHNKGFEVSDRIVEMCVKQLKVLGLHCAYASAAYSEQGQPAYYNEKPPKARELNVLCNGTTARGNDDWIYQPHLR